MDERTTILNRMFLILGLILLIPCVLGFQLLRINFYEGEKLRELWSKQAIDLIPIPAQRGNIYDANGILLATNAIDYKIALDPKVENINSKTIDNLTKTLGRVTGQEANVFKKKITAAPKHSRYVVLAENLTLQQKEEISALNLKGVIIEENYRRKYTFNNLASHLLGFVNYNMDGQIGLEAHYNRQLKGEDGLRQVRRDPFNRIYEYIGAPKKLPKNGYSLHTTINAYLQAILEDELKKGVQKTNANYGTGIILDPKTGAIQALANYPDFDPNFPGRSPNESRRNRAISDMMEPGSTFKLVTAIAAVEQDVVDFNEVFETPDNGVKVIHDLILRDHDPLGNLSFQQVIQKSSNIATAEIAMRLQPEIFYQYARNLGFGTPTNVDLIGEESGRLSKPYEWSLVTLPWMSHGYEIQATPLQIAQAYAAFANNGKLMRPFVVDKIEDAKGNIVLDNKPDVIRRAAEKSTIEKLIPVFQSVVHDSGTGYLSQVDGLAIAGKTGTSKKVMNGRYINKYRGSFVGFFPVDEPEYVVFILLDEPTNSFYGGLTAGPVFRNIAVRIAGFDNDIQKEITQSEQAESESVIMPLVEGLTRTQAERILSALSLTPEISGKDGFVFVQQPEAGTALPKGAKVTVKLADLSVAAEQRTTKDGYSEVPDLAGMNMRQAAALLLESGLEITVIGSGTITNQFPQAGEWLKKGLPVTVRGKSRSLESLTESAS